MQKIIFENCEKVLIKNINLLYNEIEDGRYVADDDYMEYLEVGCSQKSKKMQSFRVDFPI